MAEDLVSTGEAARQVGYTRHSITRWVREGKLQPADRSPGGHLRWNVSDLRRQLAELAEVEHGGHAADGSRKG